MPIDWIYPRLWRFIMCSPQTSYRKQLTILYPDKCKNHLNLLRSMMMKNRKLSKSWILTYTRKSFSTGLNGLDLMKTECGTLPWTFRVLPISYAPSMSTILNTLGCQRDLRNGYNHGKMEMKRWIAIQMMNTPKTEGSLGLRRGVMSQRCCWLFRLFAWLPVLDVFFSLSELSEKGYKGHTVFISSSSSFSFLMLDFLVDSYIVVWLLVRLLLSELRDTF